MHVIFRFEFAQRTDVRIFDVYVMQVFPLEFFSRTKPGSSKSSVRDSSFNYWEKFVEKILTHALLNFYLVIVTYIFAKVASRLKLKMRIRTSKCQSVFSIVFVDPLVWIHRKYDLKLQTRSLTYHE